MADHGFDGLYASQGAEKRVSFEVIAVSCDVIYCCYSLIVNINIFYFKMSSTNLPLFSLKINPLSTNVKPYPDTLSINKNSKKSTRNQISSS